MPSRSAAARRATGVVATAATTAALALLLSPLTTRAGTTFSWNSAAGGAYSTAANWTRSDGATTTAPPTIGDTATFNVPQIYNVTFGGSVAADVLNFNSGIVTFASSSGTKNFNLNTGLAQANLTDGTLTLGISGGAISLNASNLTLSADATLLTKFGSILTTSNLKVGTTPSPVASTLTVDGAGSKLTATGPATIGTTSATGYLNLLNQAAGSISGAITLGDDTGAGSLTLSNTSTLTATGSLSIGTVAGGASGTGGSLLVDSGSTLTMGTASPLILGATAGPAISTATVNNATLRTGTALTTINPTGRLAVTGATSSFTLNGDLLLAGSASFSQNSLNVASGKSITVPTGGSLTLTNAYTTAAGSALHVTGGTVTINPANPGDDTTLTLGAGASADVTNGGTLLSHAVGIGNGVTSSLTIDGAGSSLNATGSPYSSGVGTNGTGTLTLRNGASAGFDNTLYIGSFGSAANGTVSVQSGAALFAYNLDLADSATGSSRANVTVTGAGSSLVLSGSLVGGNLTSTSTLTVSSGASLVQGDTTMSPIGVPIGQGAAQLSRGLTLSINGGFVSLGTLVADPGVVSLTSGSLGFDGNLAVDPAGLLGYIVTLSPNSNLALTGSTTISPGASLTLSGGALSTGSLSNNGTLTFSAGTLALTGAAGFTVSSAGPLGATPNLSPGKSLIVSKTTTIAPTASLAVTGGSLTTDSLANSGSLTVNNYGSLSITNALTNASTGRLFLGPDLTATADGPATNAGRITLQGGATRLVGSSPLTNTGLITGDGELAKPLLNSAGGELRAESGKSLLISGPALTNNGKLNLTGGTLEFSDALTNSPTGQILGRGTLIANATLTNNGQISLSAGTTDLYGPVTNNAKILVTGSATATFYDPLTNSAGADIFTAAGSSTVFLSPVSGSGTFSGPGTKYFSDGSSTTAALESSGVTVVSESASLTTGDFVEQSLTVNGSLTTTSPTHPSKTQSLALGPSGKLDLTTAPLILDYSTPASEPTTVLASTDNASPARAMGNSPMSSSLNVQSSTVTTSPASTQIRQYLFTHQLFSSTADADPRHLLALAYAEASDLPPEAAPLLAAGLPFDTTSLLIKLTYIGDANLDGVINGDDYALLDRNFAAHTPNAFWWQGDFNYDGAVDASDYLIIDRTLGQALGFSPGFLAQRESQFGTEYVQALLTSVPEPTSPLLLLTSGYWLLAIPRSHRHQRPRATRE